MMFEGKLRGYCAWCGTGVMCVTEMAAVVQSAPYLSKSAYHGHSQW